MFKKTKIKFMLIAMCSVLGILVLILASINISTYSRARNEADQIVQTIIKYDGEFPDFKDGPITEEGFLEDFKEREKEIPFESRFFTARIVNENNIIYNLDYVASISLTDATQMTKKAIQANKTKGYVDNYRYGFSNDKTLIVFLDNSRALTQARSTLVASIAYSAGGLALFSVLLYFLSGVILKPLKLSYESQKEFITNSSHELKTPLTVIAVNNELNEMTNGKNQYNENINHQLTKMTALIKTMTELAKLDEINSVKFEETNVTELATNTVISFNEVYEEKKIKFAYNIEENLNRKTDASLLTKLLSIILENAAKYAKSAVNLRIFSEKNHLIIEENNDGEDIKDGDLNYLKQRFYRDPQKRTEVEGSGIGLSVADKIAFLLKGSMEIEGKNSIFNIRIILK